MRLVMAVATMSKALQQLFVSTFICPSLAMAVMTLCAILVSVSITMVI
jgi:hypothetical protein